jgi:hypothetical protein
MIPGHFVITNCGLVSAQGITRWTWANYRVSQGDDIVLVTPAKTFNLQGDRKQLSKYLEDKMTISGELDANTIAVRSLSKPSVGKETQSGN